MSTFPATCLRRMETVEDDVCLACFQSHPQLQLAYTNRMQCVELNLVQIEFQKPNAQTVLERVKRELDEQGHSPDFVEGFVKGLAA